MNRMVILFARNEIKDIIFGDKSITFRIWKKRRAKPGSLHKIGANRRGPYDGVIRILHVKRCKISDLTDDDIHMASLEDKSEVINLLSKMYGDDIDYDTEIWVIVFTLEGIIDEKWWPYLPYITHKHNKPIPILIDDYIEKVLSDTRKIIPKEAVDGNDAGTDA